MTQNIHDFINQEYRFGFKTDIDSDVTPKGLSEDVIRMISATKQEPEFMLSFRLKAYRHWLKMKEPRWVEAQFGPIDFQDIHYYATPKSLVKRPENLDEIDPELKRTFDK